MSQIIFERPAREWNEALPIGNGRLGAMVFGGTDRELLMLNQDSIWYGGPQDRVNPDAKENLEQIRQYILDGKIPQAEELASLALSGTPQSERPYQPLGNLEINYRWQIQTGQEPEAYQRILDMEKGAVLEEYQRGACHCRKTYLSSYPHGVIAVHMQALEGTLSFDALLSRGRFYNRVGKLDEQTIYLEGTLGDGGVSYRMAVRALASGGSCRIIGEQLVVRDVNQVTLYVGCETSFYEKDFEQKLNEVLDRAASDGYEKLLQDHEQDYRRLFGAVSLKVDTGDEEGEKLTRYFDFGRYLLMSSSRPGSLPSNLQGIWNERMEPAWDSKFTININTEMNYWPAEVCGLSECHLPLFDHLLRMWENGRRVAKNMYGCRGFVAHHNTDLWGDCAPQDIYIPATYWTQGAAWLCTHIWTHYLYTGDETFLRRMYPVMRDAVLFYEDFLIEADGYLATCPSTSPENTYILPDGVSGCLCAGPSMDNQIIRDLLEDYRKVSAVLGIRDELVDKAGEMLSKLAPNRIGKYGQLMEWREDYEEMEPGHRHISHLYALHPSHQITVDKTPELAKAASVTLERRLANGGGHTGWSCAWIINFYARLGEREKARDNLLKLWEQSTYPNLMDTHPYGPGSVFQIDGNLGATAAIAEMLVQSDEDRVLLLPALPDKWAAGELNGVVLSSGVTMELCWQDHKLSGCVLHGTERETDLVLVYDGERKGVHLNPKEMKKLW